MSNPSSWERWNLIQEWEITGNLNIFFHDTIGQIKEKHRKNSHLINHFSTSEGVSKVSAGEGAREASSLEQANK